MSPRAFGRWTPQPAPSLSGPFAVNHALAGATRFPTEGGVGPEDVVVDRAGRVLAGVEGGELLRFDPGARAVEVVARTGGRPLGVELYVDERVVVCDARRGLLLVDPARGRVEPLVTEVEGRPLRFTNNAAVARDGTIYFTDSSTEYGIDAYREDLLDHLPRGRLFARAPRGEVTRIAEGLQFANGVALAPDESFVLVAETGRYRVSRVWLSGPRAGRLEPFFDNLPGFPDNMSTGPRGTFWIAIVSPRSPLLDRLLPHPRARALVAALPAALQPQPRPYGMVVELDSDARVRRCLHDPDGGYAEITGVREHDGALWLGSLVEPAIARVRLPDA
ncbi:MAG: SMP-30/gluconolactonase/LRE family protein [Polyangiaceae bacterium]|nr:SMP-30/gluconolactonase/LRE family protein [Polyangiaceae bacterium]